MDRTSARWETPEARRQRSITLWKVIVCVVSAAALTTVIVASCLDRGGSRRSEPLPEPAYVETTSATMSAASVAVTPTTTTNATSTATSTSASAPPVAPVTTSISDSTGGPAAVLAAPAARLTAPPAIAMPPAPAPTPAPVPASPTMVTSSEGETELDAGDAMAPVAGHASHAANDPSNRASNPESPPMSAGAGPFITEAPYWTSSAMTSNPEAGAGPFR